MRNLIFDLRNNFLSWRGVSVLFKFQQEIFWRKNKSYKKGFALCRKPGTVEIDFIGFMILEIVLCSRASVLKLAFIITDSRSALRWASKSSLSFLGQVKWLDSSPLHVKSISLISWLIAGNYTTAYTLHKMNKTSSQSKPKQHWPFLLHCYGACMAHIINH